MNQGGESFSGLDPNLVKKYEAVDASQGHVSSVPGNYPWSSSTGPASGSWNSYETYNPPIQNGVTASSVNHYDTQKEMSVTGNAHGANSAPSAPTLSSLSAANATQEYTSYGHYSSPTGQYMYSNTEYQNYYAYQQPASSSSSSQAQQVGACQNTGAPYHQSFSSFQHSGSYAAPSSYSSTYYNPGDHQTTTTAGYLSNNYANQSQTNYWNDGSTGSYPPHQYSNYTSPVANTQITSNVTPNSHQYQQYSQWPYYYYPPASTGSSDPGAENTLGSSAPACHIQAPSGGYPLPSNQPPPPGTTSWRREFGPSFLQDNTNAATHNVNSSQVVPSESQSHQMNQMAPNFQMPSGSQIHQMNQMAPNFQMPSGSQSHQMNQMAPNFQMPTDSSLLPPDKCEDQQKKTYSQAPNLQPPSTNQGLENVQPSVQTSTMLDTRRVSKMQIPTNPRIAPTLASGMLKANKESSTTNATLKPAYISVPVQKSSNIKSSSHDDAEAMMKTLPASLRTFVERTFARCKDDGQRVANQKLMKEVIAKASADGTLFTRNWDIEPLFPLPNSTLDENSPNITQRSPTIPTFSKFKRSPNRRTKSRWEPIADEKLVEKLASVSNDLSKTVQRGVDIRKNGSKDSGWNGINFISSQQQTSLGKTTHRPLKKPRFGDTATVNPNDASSDSDKEQGLTKYYASAIALADSPEEKKRREHRFKRFEKGQDGSAEDKQHRLKASDAEDIQTRRANAMLLAKINEVSYSRAVEDIDWDALTVKGTCQQIEKRYLRLTTAPDPKHVRPEEVLEKALDMVQTSQKNYHFKCDQLKSIRQDLTVQRIRNGLTVKVYETHARLALEAGDLPEYNQCQSQLKILYAEGIKGCNVEFSAYNLLHLILHSSNNRDLVSAMTRLSKEAKMDKAVNHALAVRSAVSSGNYILFFRLYKDAPNLNSSLMDLYVEKIRFNAIKCICKSYRPTLPVSYIAQNLGFSREAQTDDSEDKEKNGLDECEEWLKAHGAILIVDNNGELQLDTKATSSTLFMPEPEDAVAHGDTSLAVEAFLTRAT